MALWMYPDSRYYDGWYDSPPVTPSPSDGDIKSQVVDRLRVNPYTKDHDLRVDVKAGVVILQGVVASRLAKRSAGDDAWDTMGVVDVSNQLEVADVPVMDAAPRQVMDAMSPNPVVVGVDESVAAAAARMRDADIGSVVVVSAGGNVAGIVTDRDIAVRGVAEGRQPTATAVAEIASPSVVTVTPTDDLDTVVDVMRTRAIRRVPVVADGQPVGVLSLGDLARLRDPGSVLADISGAKPNNDRPVRR
jgi:CBS domain-containing protein